MKVGGMGLDHNHLGTFRCSAQSRGRRSRVSTLFGLLSEIVLNRQQNDQYLPPRRCETLHRSGQQADNIEQD